MKLTNVIAIVLIICLGATSINASNDETININFKNLDINDLIKVTSKIINKNILIEHKISGKVDFISNKPLKKDKLIEVLTYVLEGKGYTLIDSGGLMRVVRINDAAKHNMPVVNNEKIKTFQMVTEIFAVNNANVDYVSSKIRHLISRSAKLVTDKSSNSIIITDFSRNIDTIKKVILIISRDAKKYVKTVKLNNIDASSIITDIKNIAKTIYNEKVEKEKVTALLNKDTNSIMLVGKRKNVRYLEKYLQKLDKKGSLVEKTVKVIYLKNAQSVSVIKILAGIIANKKYKDEDKKPYVSSDDESNAIILMGAKKQLLYFEELISKLDIEKQQVYVKARIIEISDNKTKDVGIKYGLSAFEKGSKGLASFTSALNGKVSLATDAIASTGFSLNGLDSALSLGISLNLLNKNGAADIVSEPSLLCLNNKASSIYVGQTVSVKSSKTNGTASTESFTREDIGLTLKIKPRISNGGKVLLEIDTKIEDVTNQEGANDQPNTSKKELSTTAIVNDGESVILGGYTRSINSNTIDKLPLLGDIPILGTLFRNNANANDKINLVIIITPYIVPKSKDLTFIRNKLTKLKALEDKYTNDAIKKLENNEDNNTYKSKKQNHILKDDSINRMYGI